MGRPSKYNEKTVELLKKFIRDGFTIRQACYGVDISEDTFSRWRAKYPEFNDVVNEATNRQWESSLSLAKYGCRTYKRPSRPAKPLTDALEAPQDTFDDRFNRLVHEDDEPQNGKFHGLPIRHMTMGTEKINTYYYDPSNGFVFWEDRNGITHTMAYETYKRKTNPVQDYFLGEVF